MPQLSDLHTFGRQLRALLTGLLGTGEPGRPEPEPGRPEPGGFTRDPAAERAVRQELDRMHVAFDGQDVDGIVSSLADDDFVGIYELDPETAQPVKMTGKGDVQNYLSNAFQLYAASNATTLSQDIPVTQVVASQDLAFVTEECKVKVQRPDGTSQLQALRGTSVLRQSDDGWKFMHWHMSEVAPREEFDAAGNPIEGPP